MVCSDFFTIVMQCLTAACEESNAIASLYLLSTKAISRSLYRRHAVLNCCMQGKRSYILSPPTTYKGMYGAESTSGTARLAALAEYRAAAIPMIAAELIMLMERTLRRYSVQETKTKGS